MRLHLIQLVRKRLLFILIGFLSLFFLLSFFPGCQKPPSQDNFILITLDTQRADFISSYQPDKASTPHIDFLAQEGTLYENCYSLIPITLPSHASIFFSEPPYTLKNYNNGQAISRTRKRPSFVNIFRKNGYATAAFVSLGVLKSQFGLDEGFQEYQDEFPKGRWYLAAEEVNRHVFSWLDRNKEKKFFLWIHYSDPHDPYAPPTLPPDMKVFLNGEFLGEYCLNKYTTYEVPLKLKEGKNTLRFEVNNLYRDKSYAFQARFDELNIKDKEIGIQFSRGWLIQDENSFFFSKKQSIIDLDCPSPGRQTMLSFRGRLLLPIQAVRELYRREVEYMDGEIGKLWDKLREANLFPKTHILMVGDHGEGLGEYLNQMGDPHIGHIHFLYDIYMKVPLIIYDPYAVKRGIRISSSVTLLDVGPTIISIMGLKRLSHFQGRNLLRLGKKKEFTIYQETYTPEAVKDRFAILQFPWHLIFTPEEKTYELFDLKTDPDEKENIFSGKPLSSKVVKLKKELDSFVREAMKEKKEIKIDNKTKEMLRTLGYIK